MKGNGISYSEPGLRFLRFEDGIQRALSRVMRSGSYILGDHGLQFEEAFAQYLGAKFCVTVNSGTDALALSLMAAGVKPGDEVIAPAITAAATVTAILQTGATPVIVDVEPPAYCISSDAIRQAVTSRTVAIVPVHLHGFAANLREISALAKECNLLVVEDCAQAHGAALEGKKLGTWGDAAAFSFYPTKNLGCLGDGGAIVTDNPEIAERARHLRNYGMNEDQRVLRPGFNSRLDEMQAAVLLELLPHLDEANEERRQFAKKYTERLREYAGCLPPFLPEAVYHQYPVRVVWRDAFREQMKGMGIATGIHYPYTLKDHPAFAPYCRSLPVAEMVVRQFVSVPIQPEILNEQFEPVVTAIELCLKNQSSYTPAAPR